MKLPFRPSKKKKLHAAAVRRVRDADYTDEPNVKLSSAFVVVLVLHVVAVGGIYAFNALKAHQPASYEETDTPPPVGAKSVADATPSPQTETAAAADTTAAATPEPELTYRVRGGDTILRIASAYGVSAEQVIKLNDLEDKGGIHVGEILDLPSGAVAPTPRPRGLADSGNIYTVVRGDTPQRIARKLHVGYEDLIRLNNIEDPRRLRIGSKLKVPTRRAEA
jgi:LysM repeat protein